MTIYATDVVRDGPSGLESMQSDYNATCVCVKQEISKLKDLRGNDKECKDTSGKLSRVYASLVPTIQNFDFKRNIFLL